MKKNNQKKSAFAATLADGLVMPSTVSVAMADIGGAVKDSSQADPALRSIGLVSRPCSRP